MHSITGNPANYGNTATTPDDGDPRTVASIEPAFQQLLDNTSSLNASRSALADIATLKAIASPADGLVRLVKSKGVYVFDGSSVAAEALPFIVQPTVGTGRWLHELLTVQGQANGLATLDGSGKQTVSQIPNRLVSAQIAKLSSSQTTTSSTKADVPGLSLSFTGAVGDILQIDASLATVLSVSSSGVGVADIVVVDGGVTQEFGTVRQQPETIPAALSLGGLCVVQNAGSITVKVRYSTTGLSFQVSGSAAGTSAQSNLRVLQFRP